MIKLRDLEDVMSSYRQQRAQLIEMMDEADYSLLCEEVMQFALYCLSQLILTDTMYQWKKF